MRLARILPRSQRPSTCWPAETLPTYQVGLPTRSRARCLPDRSAAFVEAAVRFGPFRVIIMDNREPIWR